MFSALEKLDRFIHKTDISTCAYFVHVLLRFISVVVCYNVFTKCEEEATLE